MAHLSPLLSIINDASQKAAPSLRRDFGEIELLQSANAGAYEYAKAAATRITKHIYKELAPARADYGFVFRTGETVEGADKTHRWLIDPIAGQMNFAHAITHFGIAITLERTQDNITTPVASVIYNPILDENYYSENGTGAFCNNNRMRVSRKQGLAGALIACTDTSLAETLKEAGAHIRICGGDALDYAYVCAGKYDAVIATAPPLWEAQAAKIFAQETGGLLIENEKYFALAGEGVWAALKEII